MSDGKMTYEDWLRGCVYHDGRHGYVTLPCDEVLKIADFIERLRTMQHVQHVESVENNSDIIVRSNLEQFRVGLEYHTDGTHFGKAKGESITTNKVEDEPKTENLTPLRTEDYCVYCNHVKCNTCVADGNDEYCVPSGFEKPKTDKPDLFDLMNRFEELCNDIKMQLRQSSAQIASAIRETKQ